MVRAGGVVRVDPRLDRVLVAPRDDRVDEPVGAAVGEVVVAEAEAAQVVRVVGQRRGRSPWPAGRWRAPSAGSVSSTTFCSGSSSASGPRCSRANAVCSTGTKYGCAPAARCRGELEHLRAERGEHAHRRRRRRGTRSTARRPSRRGTRASWSAACRRSGRGGLRPRRVAHAEPEQEAVRERLGERLP